MASACGSCFRHASCGAVPAGAGISCAPADSFTKSAAGPAGQVLLAAESKTIQGLSRGGAGMTRIPGPGHFLSQARRLPRVNMCCEGMTAQKPSETAPAKVPPGASAIAA
jgi:hypothetical protein